MTHDLLGDITLDGIEVELGRRCHWCSNAVLAISGPGVGPHAAALFCPRCHRSGGWLPQEAAAFLTEIIKQFGRPTEPVVIREPKQPKQAERSISMATRNEAFPSRYLKAADIPGDGVALKITKVEQERVGPEQDLKWVVSFKDEDKQLVLNGTNWDLIAAALREDDSDNWVGKVIELYATQTTFGSKMVDCIRARRHRPTTASAESV